MAAGRPGDDPITDLLVWGIPVYSEEADALFRQLARLLSARELRTWWDTEVGVAADLDQVLAALLAKLDWATTRAASSGWQVD